MSRTQPSTGTARTPAGPPITWDDFQPGVALGEACEVFDEALSGAWREIFADAEAGASDEAASIAVAMMMRGYLAVVTPRPPGNVHARQRFVLEALPERGEALTTTVRCAGKEMRRGRRYVELEVRGTGRQGRPIYHGILDLIWAA